MMEVTAVVVVLQISEHWYETKNMKTKKNILRSFYSITFFFEILTPSLHFKLQPSFMNGTILFCVK